MPRGIPPLGVVLDQITRAKVEWLRSVPETFGPVEGFRAADQAHGHARQAVRNLKTAYGGRIPFAIEELRAAGRKMRAFRDQFDREIGANAGARWPRDSGRVGPQFTGAGEALYTEIGAVMERAAETPARHPLRELGELFFIVGTIGYLFAPGARRRATR